MRISIVRRGLPSRTIGFNVVIDPDGFGLTGGKNTRTGHCFAAVIRFLPQDLCALRRFAVSSRSHFFGNDSYLVDPASSHMLV